MGRQPKPTALKRLAGNPGKRKLPPSEPQPARAVPSCPEHLPPVARAEWARIVDELGQLGLLTGLDRAALGAYCSAYARWHDAQKILSKVGMTIETPNGMIMPSPYISIINKAVDQMISIAAQFGMTPASRARVSADREQPKDPFDEFLNEGHEPRK